MSLIASFTGLPRPEYAAFIVVSGVYFDKKEPPLGVTKCEYCKTEF